MKSKSQNLYHKLPILDGLELLDAKGHTADFPFHTHDTYNITLVRERQFTTRLSDRTIHSQAGSITITNPGEVHATICDSEVGSSFFTFYVSPDVLKRLNEKQPIYFENKISDDEWLFRNLLDLSGKLGDHPKAIEKSLLTILDRLVTTHTVDKPIDEKKYNLFKSLLEEDHLEKFSLEKTASSFGMDKFKFLRLFKQYTGLTPNNYSILKRIEKSKALLRSEEDLLGIALETGFYDATHFIKHFKKITGVTPLAYRQAMLCNIVL